MELNELVRPVYQRYPVHSSTINFGNSAIPFFGPFLKIIITLLTEQTCTCSSRP